MQHTHTHMHTHTHTLVAYLNPIVATFSTIRANVRINKQHTQYRGEKISQVKRKDLYIKAREKQFSTSIDQSINQSVY